jgi:hypothetical protein
VKKSTMLMKRINRALLILPVRKIWKVNVPPIAARKSPTIKVCVVRPPPPIRKISTKAVIPAAIKLVRNDWRKGISLVTEGLSSKLSCPSSALSTQFSVYEKVLIWVEIEIIDLRLKSGLTIWILTLRKYHVIFGLS